jgi:hypothetical protein
MPFRLVHPAKEHADWCLRFPYIPAEHENTSLRDNLGLDLVASLRRSFPIFEFTSQDIENEIGDGRFT